MSSHGYDPPQDRPEGSGASSRPLAQPPQQSQPSQISNLISGQIPTEGHFKSTFQAQPAPPRQILAARPIAPAPGPTQRTGGIPIITTQSVSAQKILNVSASQHQNIIPKVQTVMGNQLDGAQIPQTIAMNLTSQTHPAGTTVLTGTGQTPVVSIAGSINLAKTGSTSSAATAVIQGQPFQMASLINRGVGVHQTTVQPGGISQVSISAATPLIQATTTQAASQSTQGHVVQASQAQAATPIMQTTQMQGGTPIVQAFNTSHIPRGAVAASALSMPKGGQVAAAVLRPTHPSSIHMPVTVSVPIPTAIQPRTMAPLKPGTPPVTAIKAATPTIAQIEQRVSPAVSASMAGNPSTVQITIQQTRPPADPVARPIISQIQAGPRTPVIQQHGQIGSSQKVVMSQAATVNPILQPATTGATTAQRLGGVNANIALNLSHVARPKKLGVSQPTATAGVTTTIAPAHGLTISQSAIPRHKIVMTQGDKPSVIPGTIVTTTGKPIGGQQFQKSRVQVMQAGNVSLAAITQASQINIGTVSSRAPLPIVSIPGNVQHNTVGGVTSTTASVSTAASIPIAKVTPQRQVHTISTTLTSQDTNREPIRAPAVQAVSGPQAGQGTTFLTQAHRASPNTTQSTTTISVPTTQTDSRQDRQSIPFPYTLPANIPAQELGYYNPVQFANYQNLLYQAQLTQGNTMGGVRPAAIVQTQTPNLAATLQTAGSGVSVAGGQGVRISHPMMVTVDPTRHPTLSVHAQYAQAADSKDSGAAASGNVSIPVSSAPAVGGHSGGPSSVPVSQPNASPRPSILRKRTNEGITVVKKNLLTSITSVENQMSVSDNLPGSSPKPSTPHDPSRENSQSSTDTASSAESTPQSLPPADIKIKEEPPDTADHMTASEVNSTLALASLSNNIEASPRKKPRKQSLHANTEQMRDGTSTDEEIEKFSAKVNLKRELEKVAEEVKKEDLEEYVDEEGVRWTKDKKRPPVNLMNHYQCTWKTRNNHFQRYTDVKPKEERRPTVNELANQKAVHQKASGWKMYHLAAQLEEVMDQEREVLRKISGVRDNVAPKHMSIKYATMEDDIGMIHELTAGNIQRSQLVIDQLEEARSSMLKILNHKARISEIITKHHSKRPVKKKERT